jgi:exopolyphosphatase/guanosine-5'-triphosphate,3'-diphosphate pyrophosphatase
MIFAAIDIGSNSVRCLFCYVIEQKGKIIYKTRELIRLPIRLGDDSFLKNEISPGKTEKLVSAIKAFESLMRVFEVVSYRACATSAMRNAKNGPAIIKRIQEETGVLIEIIDGKTEAEIILSNRVEDALDANSSYLYIDVGGGSAELNLISKGKVLASKSFEIGTIRFLLEKVNKDEWDSFKDWVKKNTSGIKDLVAIGSGGNINKAFKICGKKDSKFLSFDSIKAIHENISSYSIDDRITVLGLNPDRADVIVPALKVYLSAMKHGNIEKIMVPQVGLSDGMIHGLYEAHLQKIKGISSEVFPKIIS